MFNFWTILVNFENVHFCKILITKFKKCRSTNSIKIDEILLIFDDFCYDCYFSLTKFSKIIRFWENCHFTKIKISFRVDKFCVTSLASFSWPNVRHTHSNFTIRKISLFWYDFVKQSSPNSSYRSPKRRNEIVTQNFVKFSRASF